MRRNLNKQCLSVGANIPSLSVETQRIAGYSHIRETLNLLCFRCVVVGQLVDGCVSLMRCNIYNRFACAGTFKTGLSFLCFTLDKASLSSVFIVFLSSYLTSSVTNDHPT